MSGPTQPLIRLSTGKPALTALDAVFDRSDELLSRIGLARESFDDPEIFVHAIVMYQFFEEAAAAAEVPFLLAKIGKMIAGSKCPPLGRGRRLRCYVGIVSHQTGCGGN